MTLPIDNTYLVTNTISEASLNELCSQLTTLSIEAQKSSHVAYEKFYTFTDRQGRNWQLEKISKENSIIFQQNSLTSLEGRTILLNNIQCGTIRLAPNFKNLLIYNDYVYYVTETVGHRLGLVKQHLMNTSDATLYIQ